MPCLVARTLFVLVHRVHGRTAEVAVHADSGVAIAVDFDAKVVDFDEVAGIGSRADDDKRARPESVVAVRKQLGASQCERVRAQVGVNDWRGGHIDFVQQQGLPAAVAAFRADAGIAVVENGEQPIRLDLSVMLMAELGP